MIHSEGDDFDAGSFRNNQIPINFKKSSTKASKILEIPKNKKFENPKNLEKKKKFINIYNRVLKEVPIAMVLKTTGKDIKSFNFKPKSFGKLLTRKN